MCNLKVHERTEKIVSMKFWPATNELYKSVESSVIHKTIKGDNVLILVDAQLLCKSFYKYSQSQALAVKLSMNYWPLKIIIFLQEEGN